LLQAAAILSERARQSENEDELPEITLTIINIHPSNVADAKFSLRREIQTAEAAGAKIVIKVRHIHVDTRFMDATRAISALAEILFR